MECSALVVVRRVSGLIYINDRDLASKFLLPMGPSFMKDTVTSAIVETAAKVREAVSRHSV